MRHATRLLFLLLVLASACKKNAPPQEGTATSTYVPPLTDLEQFRGMCDGDTKGVRSDAPYEKKPGKLSPTAFLIRDKTDKAASWVVSKWESTKAWAPAKPGETELVACLEILTRDKKRDCNLTGHVLEQYASTMKISIFEAKTGKKLGEESFDKPAEQGCPFSYMFTSTRQANYGDVGLEMMKRVAAHQPTDAPRPLVPVWDMRHACPASAAFGGAAYQAAPGSKNVAVAFRSDGDGLYWQNKNVFANDAWGARLDDAVAKKGPVNAVVCMTAERKDKALSCPYYGGGPLEVFNAEWNVAVIDPQSGKTIASTKARGRATCPETWSFADGKQTSAQPADADMVKFLKPLLDP